jgi:hypothetical protein
MPKDSVARKDLEVEQHFKGTTTMTMSRRGSRQRQVGAGSHHMTALPPKSNSTVRTASPPIS